MKMQVEYINYKIFTEVQYMANIQRFGSVSKVKPEKLEYYKKLHANPWPQINKMIKDCNIQNYSIYYNDGYLFTYYEYVGDDYEADMAKMAADPETQKWWAECIPCLNPLSDDGPWLNMERVYRLD